MPLSILILLIFIWHGTRPEWQCSRLSPRIIRTTRVRRKQATLLARRLAFDVRWLSSRLHEKGFFRLNSDVEGFASAV
jgi:hypothetical protein